MPNVTYDRAVRLGLGDSSKWTLFVSLASRTRSNRIRWSAWKAATAFPFKGRVRQWAERQTALDCQSDEVSQVALLGSQALPNAMCEQVVDILYAAYRPPQDDLPPLAAPEDVNLQETESPVDEAWRQDAAGLASAILASQGEYDMPRLRRMVLSAEDVVFTPDQSRQLAPWLLGFAERFRDSDDPEDQPPVWSAIRTGASMLEPSEVDRLVPLLSAGHRIPTCLVALKMIGRIFEAQPPSGVDQHQRLATEVRQIANSLLNPYAIAVSQSAAMAQLAVCALAALASSEADRSAESVRSLNIAWFARQTHRRLRELQHTWAHRPAPVAEEVRALLDRVALSLGAS